MWQVVTRDIFRSWLMGCVFLDREVALSQMRDASFPRKTISALLSKEYVQQVEVADYLQVCAIGMRCVLPDRSVALWPLRIAPFPEESITSWVIRVAARYHVPPRLIVEALGEKPKIIFDLDELRWGDLIGRLLAAMGVSYGYLLDSSRLLSVQGYVERKGGTRYGCNNVWSGSTPFCSLCLSEDPIPYLRRYWRGQLVTTCYKHSVLLSDVCPSCERSVNFHARYSPKIISGYVPFKECPNCRFPVERFPAMESTANHSASLIELYSHCGIGVRLGDRIVAYEDYCTAIKSGCALFSIPTANDNLFTFVRDLVEGLVDVNMLKNFTETNFRMEERSIAERHMLISLSNIIMSDIRSMEFQYVSNIMRRHLVNDRKDRYRKESVDAAKCLLEGIEINHGVLKDTSRIFPYLAKSSSVSWSRFVHINRQN